MFKALMIVEGGVNTPKFKLELVPPPTTSICGAPLLQLQYIFQFSKKLAFGVVM